MAGSDATDPSVLGRAVAVLRSFSMEDATLSFTELRHRTGLPKATLHRVLASLVRTGLLEREEGDYRLSGLMFELGMRASTERTVLEVTMPFLHDLHRRTGETVHVGLRHGRDVVYVAKIGGHRVSPAPSRVGGRMPLHATALGKVLLAHAPTALRQEVLSSPLRRMAPRTVVNATVLSDQLVAVAARGIAYEYEESAVGVACVAAPVRETDGAVAAAMSVTGRVGGFRPDRHLEALQEVVAGASATLVRRAAGVA